MAQRRKPVKKKVERWNDPPRRGNPLGLALILAGAGGLLYAACAPKVKDAADSVPAVVARVAPAVTPRGRYVPPARANKSPAPAVHVDERAADDDDDRDDDAPRAKRHRRAADPAPARRDDAAVRVKETAPARTPRREEATIPTPEAEPPEPRPEPTPTPKRAAPAVAPRAAAPDKPGGAVMVSAAEFSRNAAATGEVALTFDGCYDDRPLGDILAALDHHGYQATFFIAGVFADRYPASVRRIADASMEIGNHSWDHPAFTKLSDAAIDRQLTRTNDLITKITGQRPDLFRPPFGARDNRVRKAVAGEGFHTVYWALDSWDSVKKGITSKEISDRVLSRVRPGDVVLLHVGSRATADALPEILKGLDARGLRVVPVSRLMK